MPILADRIKEITITTGTGTIALGGAVTDFRSFNSVLSNGVTVRYVIDDYAGNWEVGNGIVGTNTLTRSVLKSSNANTLVNFGAGNKYVYIAATSADYLPDQSANSGKILTTDGNIPSWTGSIPSLAQSTGSTLISTTNGGTGAVTRTVASKLNDVISVKDFGAVGDGVTDDTAAVQAALTYAGSIPLNTKRVYAPSGNYLIDTVYIPDGVVLFGDGISETTARTLTRFTQKSSVDVFRFIPHNSGGKNYWLGRISNIAIFGNVTFASGWGIAFRDYLNATVSMQDKSCIEDVVIRRCPSGGIEVPNSGLPFVFQRIKLLWNNGPGIKITSLYANQHQSITLSDISGDGNTDGLISLNNLDDHGSVNIINLKSEAKINTDYSGTITAQQNPIMLTSCNGTPINIIGATHICSTPSGSFYEKPGSLIKITNANFPKIFWSGVAIRIRVGDIGTDPSIVEYGSTVAIPYTLTHGFFGNEDALHIGTSSDITSCFGVTNTYNAKSVEGPAFQVAGVTPAISLYETDAEIDSKMWLVTASGGEMSIRTISDSGATQLILAKFDRSKLTVGANSSAVYFRLNGTSTTTVGATGAATVLPANPVGYIQININGTERKIPYYNT